ncbi:hypothetical protein FA95DRAFT_415452 [Auriscalpium vulgare]|uniref:Uncharacterized protein n=1 Tax=Auriscalpium vulgare TaxID=40419 RepID=A0ACB8S4C8_9AGAM|nr:hypothetical protein FA95DRAFT_415452 [Auriscalpium vulgare]
MVVVMVSTNIVYCYLLRVGIACASTRHRITKQLAVNNQSGAMIDLHIACPQTRRPIQPLNRVLWHPTLFSGPAIVSLNKYSALYPRRTFILRTSYKSLTSSASPSPRVHRRLTEPMPATAKLTPPRLLNVLRAHISMLPVCTHVRAPNKSRTACFESGGEIRPGQRAGHASCVTERLCSRRRVRTGCTLRDIGPNTVRYGLSI